MHGRNIEPGTLGQKAKTTTTEQKRTLQHSCHVLCLNQDAARHHGVVSVTIPFKVPIVAN